MLKRVGVPEVVLCQKHLDVVWKMFDASLWLQAALEVRLRLRRIPRNFAFENASMLKELRDGHFSPKLVFFLVCPCFGLVVITPISLIWCPIW